MAKSYIVLARKYRPQNFTDLVGQEFMAKTIANSIKYNRLAHAILLCGIRGIGKTTSARIIAKAINCQNPITTDAGLVEPCNNCGSCLAITNDNHPDVIEMDAASRTGVGDVREIIENTRYLPVMGKYKVYIIDEAHMLSNNAFNAFLKTLEEPPAHVKFIFATTESRKIPITVLSRCQRFDLKRLQDDELAAHLKNICAKENFAIEPEALDIIAHCAEGSCRDGLSLLDRFISFTMSEGVKADANSARQLFGLVGKGETISLLEAICQANVAEATAKAAQGFDAGLESGALIKDLVELIIITAKIKAIGTLPDNIDLTNQDCQKLQAIANQKTMAFIMRLWQVALKSIEEIRYSPIPKLGLEMIMIKLCYVNNMPTIDEIISKMNSGNYSTTSANSESVSNIIVPAKLKLNSFNDLIELAKVKNELILYHNLIEDVRLVDFEQGKLVVALNEHAPKNIASQLINFISDNIGSKWQVIISESPEGLSYNQQQQQEEIAIMEEIKQDELVQDLFAQFPNANITKVNQS